MRRMFLALGARDRDFLNFLNLSSVRSYMFILFYALCM